MKSDFKNKTVLRTYHTMKRRDIILYAVDAAPGGCTKYWKGLC